jgi:hypothetical protein
MTIASNAGAEGSVIVEKLLMQVNQTLSGLLSLPL